MNIKCDLIDCGCHSSSFVWVSPILKCIYFEIPKCGSASIKQALIKKYKLFRLENRNDYKNYPDYISFTIIRNPIDRFISCYKMFCKSNILMRHTQIKKLFNISDHNISIEEFIKYSLVHKNHHWDFQFKYILNDSIDHILSLENIENDWKILQEIFGIDISLPIINNTKELHINENNIQLIKDLYADDLIFYNQFKKKHLI